MSGLDPRTPESGVCQIVEQTSRSNRLLAIGSAAVTPISSLPPLSCGKVRWVFGDMGLHRADQIVGKSHIRWYNSKPDTSVDEMVFLKSSTYLQYFLTNPAQHL
jgi:hypothetical protein